MKPLPVLVAVLSLTAGCATVDYVGSSYQPSDHVDLFFSEKDISQEYQVIGQATARGDQYSSASKVQRKMMARARQVGADAVVVLDVGRTPGNDATRYEETTTEAKSEDGKTVQRTATVSNAAATGHQIKALFIKYR